MFENVQVLGDMPVDDFLASMGLMCASLGWDCANCHVNAGTREVDWAADPPAKIMARRMVRMVDAINRDHFGGRQVVSCFTCHHTRDRPLPTPTMEHAYGAPALYADDLLAGVPGAPPAATILHRYVEALGGAQAVRELTSYRASRRQIAQMLETFSLAPEVSAFDLGCLNHETGRMSFRKTWTAPEVRKAFGWLAARNATGSSCYIRPAEALGRTSWVLAGPQARAGLERLAAAPGLVVESSPGIFEAWLRLAAPVDAAARSAAARLFTRAAGGDAGAVRAAQLGHLPGTTNRAPARAGDGPAFFAALRLRSPSAVTPIPSAVEPFMGQRRGGGGELAAAGEKTAGRRDDPDRSRRDFAIACRLLETGAGAHAVAATIAAARGSDPQCAGAYIPRTIRAARLHLQHKEG